MNVSVSVSTADGLPIQDGVRIAVNHGPANEVQKGQLTLVPSAWPLDLTVTRTGYFPQDISINLDNRSGSPIWDDPGCLVSSSGSDLTIRVPLGRLTPAPTKPWRTPIEGLEYDGGYIAISKAVLDGFKAPNTPFNNDFIEPLQHTFIRDDGQYAFLYGGKTRFYAATSPQLLGNVDGEQGWKCFNAQASDIEPITEGHFTFVEWTSPEAGSQDPRYLVALWSPRSAKASTAATRDVIVFYTPYPKWLPRGNLFFPTDKRPYRGHYPYAANQRGLGGGKDNPQWLAQRYVELALRYLFNERHLVYDLLAAGRDALVIVPICPSGQWAVFSQPNGLQRLLSEAILFDRRAQDDPTKGPLDTAPGAPRRPGIAEPGAVRVLRPYPPPPSLGTVVVALTSGGIDPVRSLLQVASTPPAARIGGVGDLYASDPTGLYASWREVWDFEGGSVDKDISGWVRTLITWQQAAGHYRAGVSDRVVRVYHAEYTHWTADALELMRPALGAKTVQATQRSSKNGGRARELEGPTGTAVWFSRQFLERNGPAPDWNVPASQGVPNQPAFWEGDQHHVVSTICFTHAASISGLQKVQP